MAFEVIPAIDVAGARLSRLTSDGTVAVEAFAGDPLTAAAAFVQVGAPRLHFVDLDLAQAAEPRNLDVLTEVAGLGVPVQASGGVTSATHVDRLLSAGADRVVLGSAALAHRRATEQIVAATGDRLCVGIEADGPVIRPRGGGGELPLWETLVWLRDLEVRRFVFTEVGRVGGMAGPDLDGIWAMATQTGGPILASGGIRDVADLRAVAGLGEAVEGAIVGRALQEGLDLREALHAIA